MGPNEMLHRYQQADKWLQTATGDFSEPMIKNDVVYPYWSGDSSFFWYQKTLHGGRKQGISYSRSAAFRGCLMPVYYTRMENCNGSVESY